MDHSLEYNSGRDELTIPEYGRNVQKLIQHAKTIEDDAYRQAFVEKIVQLMMQMHPQNRNLDDYRDKLWRHVFRIANYELDVMPPNGKIPNLEEALRRPAKVPYPKTKAKFRHYGNNVQKLIDKATDMEEGPKREGFAGVIGSYMKLAYRTWNKEHYVSDDIIKSDLESLSEGRLVMAEDATIESLTQNNRRRGKRNHDNRNSGSHKNRGKNGRKRKN